MDKLIQLLNEYAHTYADHYDDTGEEIEIKFLYHTDQCFTYEEEGKYDTLVDDVIISKRYGFIKRLVDNDKIDIDKYYEFMTNENIDISNACGELDMDKEFYYELLMILAVQDKPIEWLCGIIK